MKTNWTLLAAALACAAAGVAPAAQVVPDWVREKAADAGKEVPDDAWGFEEWSGGWAFLTNATPALVPGVDVRVQFLVDAMDVESIGMSGVSGASFAGAAGGTTLRANGKASVFRLEGDDDSTWTFRDVRFEGAGDVGGAPQHGGAIDCEAGALELLDCSFTNFCARQTGGAVSARFLSGVSTVSNCTFSGNCAGPFNGYGGALYVSAVEGAEARIDVLKSTFSGNWAENGGAIDTHCRVWEYGDPFERPIALRVADDTAFVGNRATYGGGAIMDEGELWIEGTGTVFRANRAGYDGGAVAVNGVIGEFEPVTVTVTNGVTFADNLTSTNGWATGGAISLAAPGCTLKAYGATFTNNAVRVTGSSIFADGGAVYAAEDSTNLFFRCAFVDNFVAADPAYGYGGSIATEGGETAVDTCVFDCGANAKPNCYGGAMDFSETRATILNTTVRRAQAEGVSAYLSSLAVTNCVLVGNGLDYYGIDLFLQDVTSFTTAYSAYGTVARDDSIVTLANLDTAFCLEGRTTEIYDGDTLRLDGSGFNPVAGLGLVQPGVTDFVDVGYGTKDYGYSMGAYETPTEKLVVAVDGEKTFDGTATSNGCRWTWGMYTNEVGGASAVWTDLGDPQKALVLASWTFGQAQAGEYASTNAPPSDIAASVVGKSSRIDWLMTLVDTLFTGRILPERDIVSWLDPVEYPWTGDEIRPGEAVPEQVIVSNRTQNVLLVPGRDYTLAWADNVDATNAAKVIVTCCGDYSGVFTNLFFITSYLVAYYQAGEPVGGIDRFGAVTVSNAVADVAKRHPGDGWCVDVQNSRTNGWVYVYDPTRDEPQLVLTVRYEADANGDDVPDIYQKRVLFAVVNGLWNAEEGVAGRDIVRWVTLTDPGTGLWAEDGTGVLTDVPGVGVRNANGYAPEDATHLGVWNTEDGRSPLGLTVSRETTFPIYLYAYPRADKPRKVRESSDVRLMAAGAGDPTSVLRNRLVVSSFSVDGESGVSGSVTAQVVDGAGEVRAETALDGSVLDVLGAERPDGEWKVLSEVLTDGVGAWGVGRHRLARFFKVRLRSAQ